MDGARGCRVERLDPGRPADLADLAAMRAAWTREHVATEEPGFEERLGAWWARQAGSRHVWVARTVDGTAVAMANVHVFERMPRPGLPDARWAYLANVWTDPAHRRRGVGRLLLEAVLDWCRSERMVRVVLNPSEVSLPLYRSVGFVPADGLMRLDL